MWVVLTRFTKRASLNVQKQGLGAKPRLEKVRATWTDGFCATPTSHVSSRELEEVGRRRGKKETGAQEGSERAEGPRAGSLGTSLGCVGRGVGLEGRRSPRPSGFAPRPRGSGGEKPARRSQSDRWASGQPRAGGFREAPPRVLRAAVAPPPCAWRP